VKNKKRKWPRVLLFLILIGGTATGLYLYFSRQSVPVSAQEYVPPTFPLAKTDMVKTVSVSGVVRSAETQNVYSTQTYPVKEVLAGVGDRVKAGDVLARLDMSRLQNEITQAEINLEGARLTVNEETRSISNSLSNAQTSVESSQISLERQMLNTANAEADLREAELNMEEPFDSYAYDKAIEDAQLAIRRRTADLETAKQNLDDVFTEFDDYAYQTAINDAKILLDRRIGEHTDAVMELSEEKDAAIESFDDYAYRNAVSDAEKTYKRRVEDYKAAEENYYNEYNNFVYLASNPEIPYESANAAWAKVLAAQSSMDTAERAIDDAEAARARAKNDLSRAEDEYEEQSADSKDQSVSGAEKAVKTARNAVDDAQRAYDKAQSELLRAQRDAADKNTDAAEAANDSVKKAQDALTDANRVYEKALTDKLRAMEDYTEANEQQLETAWKNLNDSAKQLQTAENGLKSAENSLAQAQGKPGPSSNNIRLQELTLERLNAQLLEGEIIATQDGVITEAYATTGASPTGLLFVIEDTGKLYVSANVKEYNLLSLGIGQQSYVTTDATGDRVYDASVSYITPKAVSAAGSTSVEFEIRADVENSDDDIRIGMNAFLNVETDARADVFAVPISAVVTDGRGSFVYALENGERREIPVTVGLKTSTQAEISGEGLTEGLPLIERPNVTAESSPNSMSPMMMFGGR
jgi:multidrug efflux pump subunit AcrA (membrane-fusion protein)